MTVNGLVNRLWLESYSLVSVLSRRGQDEFVEDRLRDVQGMVLNVGCGGRKLNGSLNTREIRIDIDRHRSPEVQADACNLPFADSLFDAVVSTEVLEHLHHPDGGVKEMKRVLKSGGVLILTTRFMFHIHDAPNDFFRFTRYGLEFLFREFQEVRVQPQHSGYLSFLVMAGRLQMEKATVIRWLSLPLAIVVVALSLLEPIARRVFPIETVTTGYFVLCRK